MVFDCGVLGSFLISSSAATVTTATINGGTITIPASGTVSAQCAGVLDVVLGDAGQTFLGMVGGLEGWSTGLLMGLAGIVCAGTLAYAVLHR